MDKVICKNRKDLYTFLDTFDWKSKQETELSSVYFLIENEGHTEPLYFMHHEDVWFESPCYLYSQSMSKKELIRYVKDIYSKGSFDKAFQYEQTMYKNGVHYQIDCPQVSPFLEKNFEILDVLSESECRDWRLENDE